MEKLPGPVEISLFAEQIEVESADVATVHVELQSIHPHEVVSGGKGEGSAAILFKAISMKDFAGKSNAFAVAFHVLSY